METQPQTNGLDMDSLRRLIAIDKRRKELDEEAKQLNTERAGLEQALITQFEQVGMEKSTVDGRTVYVRRQLWARAAGGQTAELCARLKDDPALAVLVSETVNISKLSAHFRGVVDDLSGSMPALREEALDSVRTQFGGLLELTDAITLQTRGK